MTDYTRPATWDDLKRVAEYLNAEDTEYALIGGYAIAAHGFNRFSEDLDILVNPSRENTARWIRALRLFPRWNDGEGARPRRPFAHQGGNAGPRPRRSPRARHGNRAPEEREALVDDASTLTPHKPSRKSPATLAPDTPRPRTRTPDCTA